MMHGLSRPDCRSLGTETGAARTDLEMCRVFESVPPIESVSAHDSDHPLSPTCEPAVMPPASGHTTQIDRKSGFME